MPRFREVVIVTRIWKSDLSTNDLELCVASANLASEFVGKGRAKGIIALLEPLYKKRLLAGRVFETDFAWYRLGKPVLRPC